MENCPIDRIFYDDILAGCCKFEFDPTYPIHLNGIINQQEFIQSISKINATLSARAKKVFSIVFFSNILLSMMCFLFGAISSTNSRSFGFPPLIVVGMVLSIVGSIVFIIGIILIQTRQTARLRQAVADESMKYSTRSPTPCSWRLETTRAYFGGNSNRNIFYHVWQRKSISVHRNFCWLFLLVDYWYWPVVCSRNWWLSDVIYVWTTESIFIVTSIIFELIDNILFAMWSSSARSFRSILLVMWTSIWQILEFCSLQ